MLPEQSLPDFDELNTLEQWYGEGRSLALVTVIETWGSSPRAVGSHCVIDSEGNFAGSVSGGCIEGAVILEAHAVIAGGQPRRLDFAVADEEAWSVGLSCGGAIALWVEPVDAVLAKALVQLNRWRAERQAAYRLLDLESGRSTWHLQSNLPVNYQDRAQQLAKGQGSGSLADEDFLQSYLPAYRMLIVGAVHIAQRLVPMAEAAGYAITLIDPRRAFATAERFPRVQLSHDWPDEILPAIKPDPQTAVVVLTHDPKIDDPALQSALATNCFYIGALGSVRSHEKRKARLIEAGVPETALARIHGPIGIKLGGRSPEAIAVSILAEVTRERFSADHFASHSASHEAAS